MESAFFMPERPFHLPCHGWYFRVAWITSRAVEILNVEVNDFLHRNAEGARGEIMDKLRGADLETLWKVREVLGN